MRRIVLVLLLAVFFISPAVFANERDNRVVIIDLGGLTFEDIQNLKLNNLKKIIKEGSAALMNTNTDSSRNLQNGFLTLGAGIITSYGGQQGNAYLTGELVEGERAGEIYFRRTGLRPPQDSVVVLDLTRARNLTEEEGWGRLGSILNKNGYKTALIGNWDVKGLQGRSAALMLMNSQGIVDIGFMDVLAEGTGSLEAATDYKKVIGKFLALPKEAKVVFIEPGDLRRLEALKKDIAPEVYEAARLKYAQKMDAFLADFTSLLPEETLLLLLNPVPLKENQLKKELMAPLILWKKGMKPGLLTSDTTRRKGIVANLDVLPTILAHLQINTPGNRASVKYVPFEDNLQFLLELNKRLIFTYKARPSLVKGYVFSQIVTILLSLLILLRRPKKIKYIKPLLLAVTAGPLSLLFTGQLPPGNLFISTLFAVSLAAVMVITAIFLEKRAGVNSFLFVAGITALVIAADLVWGSKLMKYSTLGYDPMAGARYYGLGNEYMGVLIGATAVTSGLLMERLRQKETALVAIGLFFLGLIYLIGSPSFGVNVGGTIASTVVFALLMLLYGRVKLRYRHFLFLGLGAAAAVAVMGAISLNVESASNTHLGRTARLFIDGDFTAIKEIALRKINTNIKLIRYTIWSRVFLLGLIVLAVIFYRPMHLIKELNRRHLYLTSSLLGIVTGSLIALIFNDSGIVAAATMMIFGVAPLIYMAGTLVK